jgi:peptidyl-tRNA hydrolase
LASDGVTKDWHLSDHVLGKFAADERPVVERAVNRAADAVEAFVGEGLLEAMNRYNAPEEAANNLKSENQSEI